jgi:hypothetical protein
LNHRDEVDGYLAEREPQDIRKDIEKQLDPTGIRAGLLARRNSREKLQ